jgi:cytochrome c-type biogenesis protein
MITFLTSLGINTFLRHFNRFKKHMRAVSTVSGVFLIAMGLLIYTNYFAIFTGNLNALIIDYLYLSYW